MRLPGWTRRTRPGSRDAGGTRLAAVCPHVTLVPHWDRAEDIGQEERASTFRCDACGRQFTAAEAEALRRTESERVERTMSR